MYADYVNGIIIVDALADCRYTDHMAEPEPNSERIITPISPSLLQAIDDYRFANRSPSRAHAIRRLIELGLNVAREDK